jgi:2-iminobutanoate/2-iminopropanoate deaminase
MKNDRTHLFSERLRKNPEVLSHAVRIGDVLYVSGQLGADVRTGKLIEGDFKAEARQALENMKTILAEAGMAFDNLVKVAVFLTDIRDAQTFNELYKSYFSSPTRPARSAVAVTALAFNARVEIEGIAVA